MKFSGTKSEYRMLHIWVERRLGKPKLCRKCCTTNASRYEWANISGQYLKDVKDWERLCMPCHRVVDGQMFKTHCVHGHEMTKANTYIYPNGTMRECRKCRALRRQPKPAGLLEKEG